MKTAMIILIYQLTFVFITIDLNFSYFIKAG